MARTLDQTARDEQYNKIDSLYTEVKRTRRDLDYKPETVDRLEEDLSRFLASGQEVKESKEAG